MTGSNLAEEGVRSGQSSDTSGPSDTHANGMKALARILGVARSTLYLWRDMPGAPDPDADGRLDVAKWQEFAKQIGAKSASSQTEDKASLQAEELRVIIDDRKFRLAVKQGEYTHNSQIAAELAPRVQEAISVLRAKFERELPALYAGNPITDRALNKTAIDEVCERLSRPLPCQEGQASA